jgi:hypothetical protein
MNDPLITHETFAHSIAYADNCIYLLEETVIRKYTIGESGLEFAGEYPLDKEYKFLMSTDDGKLYLSGFQDSLAEWKDGSIVQSFGGDADYVYMNPSGSFGVSYFLKGEDVKKVTLSGDQMETTDMPLSEVGTIASLNVTNNYIFACGSSSDDSIKGHHVYVYDTDGNYKMTLESVIEDSNLGSLTHVFETENGFIGMDGNMREILFWDKDGNPIGYVRAKNTFGTSYPWFADSVMTSDGTMYTVMTQERADKSAKEALVFILSGF